MLLIHLSDLHLSSSSADFVGRANCLVDAALSAITNVQDVHLVVSGDIANWGLKEEFELGKTFLVAIACRIEKKSGIKPRIFICAGNHDCNFTGDQSVRDALLRTVREDPKIITDQIADCFGTVLSDFFELQKDLDPDIDQVDVWHSVVDVDGSHAIKYVLFNSCVMSVKKEEQGKLYLPIPPSDDLNFSRRTVYVMHHPYNWFQQDNARELAQHAATSADLVLMGHEHVLWAETLKEIYEDTSVSYLKGHALHTAGQPRESAFQVVEIDVEEGFRLTSYKWSDGRYERWAERSASETIAWPTRNGSRKLGLSPGAFNEFSSAGANFTHRNKEKINLPDIFVWPALKEVGSGKEASTYAEAQNEKSAELLTDVRSTSPLVVVRGVEQRGKTALGKMLALSLARKGLYPLFISASNVSSWRERSLNDRIHAAVDFTYGEQSRTTYMQLDPAQRILILDDFDLSQVKTGYLEGLRMLRSWFGHIYIMLDSYPGIDVALNELLGNKDFAGSKIYDILPCDYHRRLAIIEKWLLIGRGDVNYEALKLTAAKMSKIVDETLGRNLIPSVPVFVLIILQRAELSQDLNTVVKSGSHGFLYESLIRQALSAKVKAFDLVGSLTYLTAFAELLEVRGDESVSQTSFDSFHVAHCRAYALNASLAQVQAQMVAADILDDRGGVVRFRYPFHYYYFVARYLAQVESWPTLEPQIDRLVSAIHTERNANILLFLAHLGRNPRIAEKIIARADSMFDVYTDADLFARVKTFGKFDSSAVRAILYQGDRALEIMLHQRVQADADSARQNLTDAAETRLRDRLDDVLAMNAAFKTLQVLGQVLRNHAGEIHAEDKARMARTCVGLGLRLLGFINETIEDQGGELITLRAVKIRTERPDATEMDIAAELERYLPSLLVNITVGAMLGISNAIGSESLTLTIDEVLQDSDTGRMLRLATQLEHFSSFPKEEILSLESELLRGAGFLPNAVFRQFLIRRFYLFPSREELKRAVLSKFSIEALPFVALEQRKGGKRADG